MMIVTLTALNKSAMNESTLASVAVYTQPQPFPLPPPATTVPHFPPYSEPGRSACPEL